MTTGSPLHQAPSRIPHGEDPHIGMEMANLEKDWEVGIDAQKFEESLILDRPTAAPSEEHPFTSDPLSIKWILQNKVMFVMRGLPGSGKSTLAKKISRTFNNAIICSADDYFINKDGIYEFQQHRLKDAHAECQANMAAATKEVDTIIVDNTNVMYWEMRPYVVQAAQAGFHVVLAETKTHWRLEPRKLAKLNSHGVKKDFLEKKVQSYDLYVPPMYFGWFLGTKNSDKLLDVAKKYLSAVFKSCQEFKDAFDPIMARSGISDILDMFTRDMCKNTVGLHCTAKYFKRNDPESKTITYMKLVADTVGKAFKLAVSGFIITPSTFGARVKLDAEQKHFYACEAHNLEVAPSIEKDQRAHITLGTARDVMPVNTGLDALRVADQELCDVDNVPTQYFMMPGHPELNGVLKRFKDNMFVLYLEKDLIFDALFTGQYPYQERSSQKNRPSRQKAGPSRQQGIGRSKSRKK